MVAFAEAFAQDGKKKKKSMYGCPQADPQARKEKGRSLVQCGPGNLYDDRQLGLSTSKIQLF